MLSSNTKLNQWFAKQARKNEQFTSIYDMLFANKSLRYLYFRLRYFKLVTVVQFAFHTLLFFMLYRHASTHNFYHFSGHWLLSLLIAGTWWGVLEVLRTQIRELYYSHEKDKAAALIGRWLIGASLLSLMAFIMAAYYSYMASQQWAHERAYWLSAFSAVIWLSVGLKFWVSTYHAGIYAVTRILRPISSLLYAEIIAALVFCVCWHFLQMAALPVMLLTHSVINEALRYYYCKRMYRFREYLPVFNKPKRLQLGFPWQEGLLTGMSGIMIHFSGAVLGLAWLMPHTYANFNKVYAMIFLLLPLLEAGANWAMLFYFDWKKLQRINFRKLHSKYDAYILWLSPVMGAFFWLLAALVGGMLLPQFSWSTMLLLLPILILRSITAYLQIRAFANFYYFDVIVSGLITLGGVALAYYSSHSWQYVFCCMLAMFMLTIIWLWKHRLPASNRLANMRKYISPFDWLDIACSYQHSFRIYQLELKPGLYLSKHMQVVGQLVKHSLGQEGRICHLNADKLLVLQAESSVVPELHVEHLVELCGGFLTHFQCSELFSASQSNLVKDFIVTHFCKSGSLDTVDLPPDLKALKTIFLAQNPQAVFFGPEQALGKNAVKPDNKTLQSLMSSLHMILYGHLENERLPFLLLPVYDNHTVEAILALPSSSNKRQKAYWRNLVHDFNLRQILLQRAPASLHNNTGV